MNRRAFLIASMLCAGPAMAQDARALVESIARRALAISTETPGEQAREAIARILAADFDMPAIARFCAGAAWDAATPDQRARFLAAFERRAVDQIARRFRDSVGMTLTLVGERAGPDGDRLVATRLARGDEAGTTLIWRVRGPRVVDVLINGTSTAITQRDEFAPTLRANGNDLDVLTRLLTAAR